jgi:hypothetical protein
VSDAGKWQLTMAGDYFVERRDAAGQRTAWMTQEDTIDALNEAEKQRDDLVEALKHWLNARNNTGSIVRLGKLLDAIAAASPGKEE